MYKNLTMYDSNLIDYCMVNWIVLYKPQWYWHNDNSMCTEEFTS